MGTWLEDITETLTDLGGSGTLNDIYAGVAQRRPNVPPTWTNIIRNEIQGHSSDSVGYRGESDIFFSVDGLGQGIWGLRASASPTPEAVDLDGGSTDPQRSPQTTYRILRDTPLARKIKLLHRDRCQLCGEAIKLGPARTYSEAHHIIPLGGTHAGPDTADNIIVLCPNHHALCDYGGISLDITQIWQVVGHQIAAASIAYHNTEIAGRRFI